MDYRKIENDELTKIIENHKHWIDEDVDGWEDMMADLSRTDLSRANLSRADLYGANLSRADLYGANLYGANLSRANLYGANLYGANLSLADLYGANLSRANLYGADLSRANLSGADLYGANLSRANLSRANLSGADLSRANLSGANNIEEAENMPFFPLSCPDTGSFIGWKKACVELDIGENTEHLPAIVKLLIPEDAKRSSATSEKCRCDKATVLEIQSLNGSENYQNAFSGRYPDFIYTVGKTVTVPDFDENRWEECSTGIHFFINRQSAVEY